MHKYHQTTSPTRLKSDVMGGQKKAPRSNKKQINDESKNVVKQMWDEYLKTIMKKLLKLCLLTSFIFCSCDSESESASEQAIEESTVPKSVLLIGDSISIAYSELLIDSEDFKFTHIGENAVDSGNGVSRIDSWLNLNDGEEWDIVHFNFGIHDAGRVAIRGDQSDSIYRSNLLQIVDRIQTHSPNSRIIFATTTPVISLADTSIQDGNIIVLNEIAVSLFENLDVLINDLYTPILPFAPIYSIDGIHFSREGNQFNADNVLGFLRGI